MAGAQRRGLRGSGAAQPTSSGVECQGGRVEEPKPKTDALRHEDKRVNIPTSEQQDFVAEDESRPRTVRYPRDPSLDPQLVWKGKDEADAEDLAVPSVPVYVQEKIVPQALIEDLRRSSDAGADGVAETLFGDFDGLTDYETVEFYQHEANWSNRMILGDSLLVMTSLAEREALRGKVQMIYLDPPYGIKFGSNWQVSTRKRDVRDGKAEDATRQPEQVKAFRDTWELGIHSYLSYLRDRLMVARELLTESGSIFVQIGDENVHLVRNVLDEVFGSDACVSQIAFKKTTSATSETLAGIADYILWYARDREQVKYNARYESKIAGQVGGTDYIYLDINGNVRPMTSAERNGAVESAAVLTLDNMTSQRPPGDFLSISTDADFDPRQGTGKLAPPGCKG